ncbi:MAG: DMT family transporter [Hyphomicrobiaceae bacterium]
MTRLHADLVLLACAAIWGFAFLFQKSAMAHVGPLTFIAARSFVACLALAPLVVREQRQVATPPLGQLCAAAAVAGMAFFLGAAFQQFGLITASVTNTGFLTALYVVATPVIAWGLMRRRPSSLIWVAVAISFVGTWLLGGGAVDAFSPGDLLVAISALFWALHVVLLGRAAGFGAPASFTALQFAVVGLLGLAGALLFEDIRLDGILAAAIDIGYVGILSSAVTFTLFTMALRATQPTEAAVIVSSETLFAALGAYLLLGERLPPIGWLGAGAILAATLLVQFAPTRAPAPPRGARASAPLHELP